MKNLTAIEYPHEEEMIWSDTPKITERRAVSKLSSSEGVSKLGDEGIFCPNFVEPRARKREAKARVTGAAPPPMLY